MLVSCLYFQGLGMTQTLAALQAACDFSGMMPIFLFHLCIASCPTSHGLQEGPLPIINTIARNERAGTFVMPYH